MKVTILCERDLSGILYSFQSALLRHDHEVNFVKAKVNPRLQYPSDLMRADVDVGDLVKSCDVLVLKPSRSFFSLYKLDFGELVGKRVVVLLGRKYMKKAHLKRRVINKLRGYGNVKFMTTSIDLADARVQWFPPCVRVDELRRKYGVEKQVPPMVMASPSYSTNLQFGVGNKFKKVIEGLGDLEFRHVLYTGSVPNDMCLRAKAKASIFFDRIGDGVYGVNSQEAGALGCAVVTGASDEMTQRLKDEGFYCPFKIVKSVKEAICWIHLLLASDVVRERASYECLEFVREVHSGDETVKRFMEAIS